MRLDGASTAQLRQLRRRGGQQSLPDITAEPGPSADRQWFTMRRLMQMLLPLRIIAMISLGVLIGHIVRERGDVGALVWLRALALSLLALTVWTQAAAIVGRAGRRGERPGRTSPAEPTLALDRSSIAALRGAAPTDLGTASRRDVASSAGRRGVGAASWWLLIVAILAVCVAFIVVVATWMARDLDEAGAGPWLIAQLVLLGAAIFAIGWTLRSAITSYAVRGSRRRRPQVQRFINWLLRLLSLGRAGGTAGTAVRAATSPGGGGGVSSVATHVGLLSILALGVFVGSVDAAFDGGDDGPDSGVAASADDEAGDLAAVADEERVGRRDPTADVTTTVVDSEVARAAVSDVASVAAATPTSSTPTSTPSGPTTTTNLETTTTAAISVATPATTTELLAPSSTPPPATTTSQPVTSPSTPTTLPDPTPTSTTTSRATTTTSRATTTTTPRTTTTTRATTTTTTPRTTTTTRVTTTTTTPRTTTTRPACQVGGLPDTDCDFVSDVDEKTFGSDPNDRASTPEHRTWDATTGAQSCSDSRDNDGDGTVDTRDPGCNGT